MFENKIYYSSYWKFPEKENVLLYRPAYQKCGFQKWDELNRGKEIKAILTYHGGYISLLDFKPINDYLKKELFNDKTVYFKFERYHYMLYKGRKHFNLIDFNSSDNSGIPVLKKTNLSVKKIKDEVVRCKKKESEFVFTDSYGKKKATFKIFHDDDDSSSRYASNHTFTFVNDKRKIDDISSSSSSVLDEQLLTSSYESTSSTSSFESLFNLSPSLPPPYKKNKSNNELNENLFNETNGTFNDGEKSNENVIGEKDELFDVNDGEGNESFLNLLLT
jgi:hypothetical protein